MNTRWRPVAGAFLIIGIIIVWAVLVASLAHVVGSWPALVQAIFYIAAGLVWILPLKPILRWSETGRWLDDRPQG
jgi:membrane protease YdiL (CAAX protease family)